VTGGELDALLELAVDLARRGAAIHRHGRHRPLEVRTKSTKTDLVSRVDAEAERAIVEQIRAARPDDGILAEEGTDVAGSTGLRWVVDPLDGTVNYVSGYPAYACSIGFEVDGEIAGGAIVDSTRDVVYAARRDGGANRDGRPIHASDKNDLSRCLIATGFAYAAETRAEQAGAVAGILPIVADIRRGGSAALDLASVAAAEVDGYYEIGLRPWDLAAGRAIATEAGALVEVLPIVGSDDGLVVAAPVQLFEPMVRLLRESGVRLAG
jgi:myo-inositol-1(or 4)-monophosphatase